MKFFPKCSEGIRRVSIMSALLTFIVLFGWWSYYRSRQVDSWDQLCYQTYNDARGDCEHQSDAQSCNAKADRDEGSCYHAYSSLGDTVGYWGLWSLCGLFWSYIAALTVRTVGWVNVGFAKNSTTNVT